MRVATWNVNNVVKRLDLLRDWLERTYPEVVALQELKAPTADFPAKQLEAIGYRSLVVGQRTWNGVALLARGHEPLPVVTSLLGDPKDKEARYIEAAINGVLFACLYLPNDNPQPGPKFYYKMRWFERMRLARRSYEIRINRSSCLGTGTWCPRTRDIYRPDTWRDDALLHPRSLCSPPVAGLDRCAGERASGRKAIHLLGLPPQALGAQRRDAHRPHIGGRATEGARCRRGPRGTRPGRGQRPRPGLGDAGAESGKDPARRAAKKSATSRSSKTFGGTEAVETNAAPLGCYNAKRDFAKTAEPSGKAVRRRAKKSKAPAFVTPSTGASRLQYDLRLELVATVLGGGSHARPVSR